MDLFDRVMELSRYGYFCGQILAKLLLETIGEENTGLVKAMGGLNGGVGFFGGLLRLHERRRVHHILFHRQGRGHRHGLT